MAVVFDFTENFVDAGGGNRTPMSLRSRDFESRAYTDFATPARKRVCMIVVRLWRRQLWSRGRLYFRR